MNVELGHISDWFSVNKLSLYTDKTKYALFHKAKGKANLPLVAPDLFINDVKIKREKSLKFLGVMINKNLTWKSHVVLVENKISKSVRTLFKASRFLNSKSLRSTYLALVHPYINYANKARLMSSDNISISLRILMKELNIKTNKRSTTSFIYVQSKVQCNFQGI